MYSGTSHIKSTQMNLGMLRSRGMQRLKQRTRYSRFGTKSKKITIEPVSPLAVYHHEKRMKSAVAKGIRREIICYLLITVIMTVTAMMIYGIFFN